ncbi:hypothetical protein GCM10027347_08960 [Larkinella harenae]
MKKILLLTDFSEAAKKAIQFAQLLFDQTATEFHLLHAYPIEPETMYGTVFLMEEAERSAYRSLQTLLSELMGTFHPPYHSYYIRTVPGSPVGAVETVLENEVFDYVVVGASGAGLTPMLGSVATGLIRHARTQVLVVPQAVPLQPIREVVLAADYSNLHNLACLRHLKDLITAKKARLTALSVVDEQTPWLRDGGSEESMLRIETLLDSLETGPYFVLDENVEDGINQYLDENPVDLLVTIPHRKSLLDVVWSRSLTRKLAYRPRVPLLTLYDPEPAER